MIKVVLGIDQALLTGWAICVDGEIDTYGTKDFKKIRGKDNGKLFWEQRLWIVDSLNTIIENYNPTHFLLMYERAHHRGLAATTLAMAFTTRMAEEVYCHKYNLNNPDRDDVPHKLVDMSYDNVSSNVLKKYATGSGVAQKPEMVKAAQKILMDQGCLMCDLHNMDDNEADAIHLAKMGWEKINETE